MNDECLRYGQLKAYENILQIKGNKKNIINFCLNKINELEMQLDKGAKKNE